MEDQAGVVFQWKGVLSTPRICCSAQASSSAVPAASPGHLLQHLHRHRLLRFALSWGSFPALKRRNPPLQASDFPSAASSPPSALTELETVRALLWIRCGLGDAAAGLVFYPGDENFVHASSTAVSLPCRPCAHRRGTLRGLPEGVLYTHNVAERSA